MTPELQAKIDDINKYARLFNKQNYINMIVNQYKTDPKEARIACRWWMDNHPLVLADLGKLVKRELDKQSQRWT